VVNSIFANIIQHNPPPSYHAYTIFISPVQQQRTAYPLSDLWEIPVYPQWYLSTSPPGTRIEVRIQRYRCKVPHCPRVTFSVLRHPFLPIVRHFYQTILFCQSLFSESQVTQAEGARRLGVTRGVVKRLCALVARVIPWLDHEKKIAAWGPDPTIQSDQFWVDFTRDFSQSFYPWRCWKIGPT